MSTSPSLQNPVQQTVQNLLNRLVEEGRERGVQVAAYRDGELIVDAWAGIADVRSGTPVDGDTVFPVFSTTKGIAATLAHLVVDRGLIEYDTPVAEVWPEFAAHGKRDITFRHVLSHSSGLYNLPPRMDRQLLCDWDAMCKLIADMKPEAPAGQHIVYHAVTYSWTVGEVIRRVDGRSFGEMLQEEINTPLGIKGLYVGVPEDSGADIAFLEIPKGEETPVPPDDRPQSVPAYLHPLHDWMNLPSAHTACIPGSNGIMSARAVARHYAALLPGGVDGIELLSPGRVRLAMEPQSSVRPAEGETVQALGYVLSSLGSATTFGHNGYGGSGGFGSPSAGVSFSFTHNLLAKETSRDLILNAFREAADLP